MKYSNRYEKLPSLIKNIGKLCLWRYENRDGKKTKVPYTYIGTRAKSTDEKSFASFNKVVEYADQYDGIGLGIFEPFFAVDIDHCVEDGRLSELARDVAETIGSYTEYSPSGTGIRIIGLVDFGYEYDKKKYYINNPKLGLEIYVHGCTNKYVTLTGNLIDEFDSNVNVVEPSKINTVLEKYMLRTKPENHSKRKQPTGSVLSDEEVIAKALSSKNGFKFSELWEGRYSRANTNESQQEYDLALCSQLAFWCGGDMEQMDRLFRQSGLYREKWDREDYRVSTLEKAVEGCTEFYKPHKVYQPRESEEVLSKLNELDPAKNPRYSGRSDLSFGRLFADIYRDEARYVPERKKWFIYDGSKWCPDIGTLKAMELCKTLTDAMIQYTASLTDSFLQGIWLSSCEKWLIRRNREIYIKEAQSIYPISMEEFDADKYLFNCLNGTLNLRSGEFKEHNPNDKLTKMAPVEYNPLASNDRWDRYIMEVMSDDHDKARFLQKSLGYGITGDTRYECMFFLYGETTRNGKGTLMESILRVVGDYGKAVRPETIAQKPNVNSQAPSEDVARLAGIRLANISEPSRGLMLNTAQVKSMTGNDTINARFLNENSFDFRPQFKLYVNTNYLPVINDLTLFSSGRIMVIPFDKHFEEWEQDKGLKEEFAQAEAQSAILNWLIKGLTMLKDEGLKMPESVRTAIKTYEQESNKMSQFAEDCLIETTIEHRVKTAEVYEKYSRWCKENGYYPESSRNFMHELRKFGKVTRNRPTYGGNKTTVLEGYRLIENNDDFVA